MKKFIYFNNKKFTLDEKSGYYRNAGTGKRLHRYVWEYYNGEIPDEYEIHHIDHDKSNNDISNLMLVTKAEHQEIHSMELTEEERLRRRNNLIENAVPEARKWHSSEEGIKWHKQHGKSTVKKLTERTEHTCDNCGKLFLGTINSRFCSNACKSAFRRKSGKDLIEVECVICKSKFKTNKYHKALTCSKTCANKYWWRVKNESKDCQETE